MKQPLYGTKSTEAWDTLTESKWKLKSSEISLSLLRILNWKHKTKDILARWRPKDREMKKLTFHGEKEANDEINFKCTVSKENSKRLKQ